MKKIIPFLISSLMFQFAISQTIQLNVKVFLEGPFNGLTMNNVLNIQNLIPLTQPFNVSPWNYSGTEQVSLMPNPDIVDWVMVELRETTGDPSTATPDKMIYRQAGFLKSDGQIVALDGNSSISYNGTITGNLYVIIWHRNHLAVMSSLPLPEQGNIYNWDFTDQISKAYLNGQKQLSSNKFGMIGGDSDGNGRIFHSDKNVVWNNLAGNYGYYPSDLNLDSQLDNNDKDLIWSPNFGLITKVPTTISWECLLDFYDIRDSQSYSTVKIGNQCWMAENLNTGIMLNGSQSQTNNGVIEKYCYNNDPNNCATYGGLYKWNEMMQYVATEGSMGICPAGWHIPSNNDWTEFSNYLGGLGLAGGKMKEAGTSHWYPPNTGATNESGFTALPSGEGANGFNAFSNLGERGNYWSSSMENCYQDNWYRSVYYQSENLENSVDAENKSYSVRCLKNTNSPAPPCNPMPYDGSLNIGTDTTISWSFIQLDGNPCKFDIYFGTELNLPLVQSNYLDTIYFPGILNSDTSYFWKIVAHDIYGNSIEGELWNFSTRPIFKCGDNLFDERDDQIYKTVLIDKQCWMAENLNIGTMVGCFTNPSNNGIIEKYCYDNNTLDCGIYGGLYLWDEMMQYSSIEGMKGICPVGWHIPSYSEWTTLNNFLGLQAGGKMKSTGTIEDGIGFWYPPNTGATNESGFTALPGGKAWDGSLYSDLGERTWFWSSSKEYYQQKPYYLILFSQFDQVYYDLQENENGYSVRCIKDLNLPLKPNNPNPNDATLNVIVDSELSWSCNVPDNSTLKYSIYFGLAPNPQLIESNYSDTFYNPGLLYSDTSYYWKIVAHNIYGDSTTGDIWNFSTRSYSICGDNFFDIRDGQVYNTTLIGEQCWMAENLNVGTMIGGIESQSNNGIIEKYCYNNEIENCDTYGGLYFWYEMMNYITNQINQGICPQGWHLPSDAEWNIMTVALGGGDIAGGKLKETGLVHWSEPNTGATNESGFTALPGGGRYMDGNFGNLGNAGFYWSSTMNPQLPEPYIFRTLSYNSSTIYYGDEHQYHGFTVRCLKD